MANYIRLVLARDSVDGTPVVASIPTNVYPEIGDICIIDGNVCFVERDDYMNTESDEMAILSAITKIREAEAVYGQRWTKEVADAPAESE